MLPTNLCLLKEEYCKADALVKKDWYEPQRALKISFSDQPSASFIPCYLEKIWHKLPAYGKSELLSWVATFKLEETFLYSPVWQTSSVLWYLSSDAEKKVIKRRRIWQAIWLCHHTKKIGAFLTQRAWPEIWPVSQSCDLINEDKIIWVSYSLLFS